PRLPPSKVCQRGPPNASGKRRAAARIEKPSGKQSLQVCCDKLLNVEKSLPWRDRYNTECRKISRPSVLHRLVSKPGSSRGVHRPRL
ncbi:hypothetical protein, partial [Sinorhizobium terangae]|uniref:hypothetical protein n=1 Tax=Sinorhizobium terangae TaxID=110322 RepID=UPI001AEDC106